MIASDDADESPYVFGIQGRSGPEIDVVGNGISIPDGGNTPRISDDTDFGSVPVAGGATTHMLTIANSGADPLLLSEVTVVGTNSADFVITPPSDSTVVGGADTTFSIDFNPSGVGIRTATISISSNDPDEDPYTFDVQGLGRGIRFWSDDFEGNEPSQGDRDAPNHSDRDNGTVFATGDYFVRTSDAVNIANGFNETFTGVEGSSFWRGEDLENANGGTNPDVINWTGIDISGRSELLFSGLFAADDGGDQFEAVDFLRVEARVDAGEFHQHP